MVTDLRTAEMIKYASNAFLATRISFINEIASICEKLGADVKEVAIGMGYDKRIGHHFLDAGVGYGGSCFPKDVKALAHMAALHGCHPQLLRAVMEINHDLAFKPNTDDMREAPSVEIANMCRREGAYVKGYDPVAKETARKALPWMEQASDPYELSKGCDAIVILTEWNEFKHLASIAV